MEFRFIKEMTELEALADEWNALLAESITDTPFLRHEYLSAWWGTRGGGEWQGVELATVIARRDGALVGVAPLFRAGYPGGKTALLLLGSLEISDYLDLIVRQKDLAEFLHGLLDLLASEECPFWDNLAWINLPESSLSLEFTIREAGQRGWEHHLEPFRPVVSIPLSGDFESYLAGIDKKQRHEIRRKMRRAAEYDLPVRWYILDDGDKLEAEMGAFLELMAFDPEKALFLTPPMRLQMMQTARAAWQAGWLQLAFLEVAGKKAAGYLNFDYRGRIWVYNSGLDQQFLEISPGWVLLGHLLEWACQHQRSEFDFMRGDEAYKFKFGGVRRSVMHLQVRR
jgi:CelD/BcsL family acetyltransferase involved in cellulose biosynthesis